MVRGEHRPAPQGNPGFLARHQGAMLWPSAAEVHDRKHTIHKNIFLVQ